MENPRAVLAERAEQFRVGGQRAGADAKDETAFREMIEHGRMGRDQHRMGLRQIGGAGRQLDRLGFVDQRRQELKAVGDVFDRIGNMFAAKRIIKAKPVRQNKRLAILFQRFDPIAMRRVHRHREKSKSHL